jgi:DNA-binding CsgD family transcriptional regulator
MPSTADPRGGFLFGREAEVELVHRFLAAAGEDGRTLLFTGPAGIGRTALLDAAAGTAVASGAFVARTAGFEDEADVPFTGLARLLVPLGSAVDQLAPGQRAVLSSVLDQVPGAAGGHLPEVAATAEAVAAALEAGARGRPAIVVVDDLHALDGRSADCLRTLARILPGRRIGLLASAREGPGDRALPEHPLGPLDDAAASALLAVLAPGLSPAARGRLLSAAAGNPLALWRLPLRSGQAVGPRAEGDPDEEMARTLEETGLRLLDHHTAEEALVALRRSAELTPAGARCARRTARAEYLGAAVAGQLGGVSAPLAPRRHGGGLWAIAARGHLLLHGDGDLDAAHRVLVEGLEAVSPDAQPDPGALTAALDTLLTTCRLADRDEVWPPLRALVARHAEHLPPELARSLAGAGAAPSAPIGGPDPAATVRAGWSALAVDRLQPLHPALRRVLRDGRRGGAVGSAIHAAVLLALDGFATGQWDAAAALAREGQALCVAHRHTTLAMPALLASALVAAGRGDEDTCHDLTSRMIGWAAPRGARLVHRYAAHARALAALGRGDAETAFHHARAVSRPGVVEPDGHSRLLVMDLVEAAVRSRRPDEAAAHVRAAQEAGVARVSARCALLVAGATALAEPGDRAAQRYEEALALPGIEAFPFETARVRLAHGEHLRRARAALAAREQLTAALATFRELRASPWIVRTESELRAAGHRTRRARGPVPTALSHQELTVAGLAATGATNREIGERLGLSPRTVGSHLSRVFRKLDVTSRTALGAALGVEGADR